LIGSEVVFGVSDLVLSGFLRIVTHPRVFDPPTPLEKSLEFVEALRVQPNVLVLSSGRRHWGIFIRLCREANARGNLIPDAFLAALAIESGSEWVTTDRDFARFRGMRILMSRDVSSIRQPECKADSE
jgi:toxin-antitoxin system PIN domain toxin